jgi:biopolymer transport protein ExbB
MNVTTNLRRSHAIRLAALVLMAGVLAAGPLSAADGPAVGSGAAASTPAVLEQQAVPEIPARNLLEIMKAGGVMMLPILFCSVLTFVFIFERSVALRRGRVIPKPFVKRIMHQLQEGQLDRAAALQLCAENKSPVAAVFAGAFRKWGRPAVEVEQAILDEGERAVNGLRRYVRVFNAVATITPLLGLLGTVYGMITAFNEIATSDAMGKPELLAGGISEALLTTAFGLTVAIPALACYMFFISRVDGLVVALDSLGQDIVRLISAEAQQETSPRGSRSRREAA